MKLRVEYEDGRIETINLDGTWRIVEGWTIFSRKTDTTTVPGPESLTPNTSQNYRRRATSPARAARRLSRRTALRTTRGPGPARSTRASRPQVIIEARLR